MKSLWKTPRTPPPDSGPIPEWTVADRCRKARLTAGILSQTAFAEMLGLGQPAISGIESGGRRASADELRRIARATGVSLAWLRGES